MGSGFIRKRKEEGAPTTGGAATRGVFSVINSSRGTSTGARRQKEKAKTRQIGGKLARGGLVREQPGKEVPGKGPKAVRYLD